MTGPNAERYLRSRATFRGRAASRFRDDEPEAPALLGHANELVASLTFVLSGRDLRLIPNGLYIGNLIASFCRSHFAAAELLQHAELIEYAALARKQIELVARLHELDRFDLAKIERRTPHVRYLPENIRRLYAEYSRLTHSADPESIQLLGHLVDGDLIHTPLYAEFQSNVYVALNHLGLVVLAFHERATKFYLQHFPDYDPTHDEDCGRKMLPLLVSERLAVAARQRAPST